jgi:hypothetical protein
MDPDNSNLKPYKAVHIQHLPERLFAGRELRREYAVEQVMKIANVSNATASAAVDFAMGKTNMVPKALAVVSETDAVAMVDELYRVLQARVTLTTRMVAHSIEGKI